MSDSLHDIRLGPGPISEAEQERRRNRFVERFMAQMDEVDNNPQWQVPKDAKDAYRNIADDWAVAYQEQAKHLRDCRARLVALAAEAQREHNARVVEGNCRLCEAIGEGIEWLKEHPAEGGQDD